MSFHDADQEGRVVLILAPFGQDAPSAASLLGGEGYDSRICGSLVDVAAAISDEVGAVLMTEEVLRVDVAPLVAAIRAQPPWSDIPFVVLASRQTGNQRAAEATRARIAEFATNLIVLERPLSSVSLVSAIASAIRSRRRQFDMRDRLSDLRTSALTLAGRNADLAQSRSALEASEAKFQAIVDSIDQMIWSTQPNGFHDYYNQRWYDFTGVPQGSTDGQAWSGMFHPDDQDRAWSIWRHSLETGEPYHIEYRLRHRSGRYRWVLGRAQAVRDEQGRITRWFGSCTDIEEIVQARDVLARSREELERMVGERTAELSRANDFLRQSQKMEAVGQLTGGIAHDFNNMLTGIIGAIDLMKRRIAAGRYNELDRYMTAASASAQRAAALTQRLLAFSRRQSLDPKPVDVPALLRSLEDLLRRTLSERVALSIVPGGEPVTALADANQLESAILNLAINARDAMPDGGLLTIETRIVEFDERALAGKPGLAPGRYAVIAVSDTGVGMTPQILEKVFDPFFTTKPIGQGTGLGLSMVYGFAEQSNGQVRIHSRPGEGTSVTIFLPAADALALPTAEAPQVSISGGAGQPVLIVEDDASVRLLIRSLLDELGYAPLEAADPAAAIRILSADRPLDLMISDVGLPGMNGRQLAEVARQHRPDLPILFVTGYAENAAIRAGFLGTNMAMITKPFAVDDLAGKIEAILSPLPVG